MRAGRCSVVRRVSLCYIKKMRKVQDRKKIIHEISAAAELYKKNLVGRQFLYVFDGRFIEVMYKAENFLHLTGVGTGLSAKQFYKYAVNRILSTSQILFNAAHPYDLCVRKLQHLCDMAELAASECFMLEEIRTSTQLYKFGTTNLDFTCALGWIQNGKAPISRNRCVMKTALPKAGTFIQSLIFCRNRMTKSAMKSCCIWIRLLQWRRSRWRCSR